MVTPSNARTREPEAGIALLSVILVMALVSALLVGHIALISEDRAVDRSSREGTLAYGAAHAGLEQLTSRLGELFATNFNPTCTQLNTLAGTPPDLRGPDGLRYVTFTAPGSTPTTNDTSGYRLLFNCVSGFPAAEPDPRTIGSGPFEGLRGIATQYTVEVTARTTGRAESRMQRTMQTMLIPAFQFGVFSQGPLAFHSAGNFFFGGRVHTNSDLYLTAGGSLILNDHVTAVGQVIRRRLPNNALYSDGWPGYVCIQTSGCTTSMNPSNANDKKKLLNLDEGSQVDGLNSANNTAKWTAAVARLNRMIINGQTGAKELDLPLTQMGAQPIDLIRRPAIGESITNPIFQQRYYDRASLRILLSDYADDITNLPGIAAGSPVNLEDLRTGGVAWFVPGPNQVPAARVAGTSTDTTYSASSGYWEKGDTALLRGYIKIEKQNTAGVWSDVTQEILELGFTGRRLGTSLTTIPSTPCPEISPNAVIRLQRMKDDSPVSPSKLTRGDFVLGAGTTQISVNGCGFTSSATTFTYPVGGTSYTFPATSPPATGGSYWPNVLYDPREGAFRDSNQTSQTNVFLGGVIHYIELDVGNLVQWFNGSIGTTGSTAENSDGGFVVYISDRRTNKSNPLSPAAGQETGEYGFEDNINLSSSTGYPANGILDTGEDLNENEVLDNYGQNPYLLSSTTKRTGLPTPSGASNPVGHNSIRPWHLIQTKDARSNPPLFFRRAVKLVDGADGSGSTLRNLPGSLGLTVVSENPVYIQGNYNTGSAWGSGAANHRGAAIIADSVSLLSNSWNDLRSFQSPHNPKNRPSTTTWYRVAVVSGKTRFFPLQSWGSDDSGADGGVHNFLRMLEDWGGDTLNYRGSLISFYYSRQAVGSFKYHNSTSGGNYTGAPVYIAPTRNFSYDAEFLDFALLPPKPPSFRDVNTLTFRQILRPTQ